MTRASIIKKLNPHIQSITAFIKSPLKRYPIILSQNNVDEEIKSKIFSHFLLTVGYEPCLDAPITFNEKLQWYKLYYRDPVLTQCSDKYLVRDYIKDKVGEKYLVKLLGVYDEINASDLNKLPKKFVLKVNHGSAQNIICTDKSKLDKQETIEKIDQWMKPSSNHYFSSYEWGYKDIKPKIICEEYLGVVSDYKIYCFNGKAQLILFATDRQTELKMDFLDLNWEKLQFQRGPKNIDKKYNKPKQLNTIIKIANKLAERFPFVRVDFFIVKNKIYVGEMTFYPSAGLTPFEPIEWDYKLGNMLNLPTKKSTKNMTKQSFKQLLIATEIKFGGKIINVPRNRVSPFDPRTSEQLKTGGMIGGDRMLHHGYSDKYAQYLLQIYKSKRKITLVEIGVLTGIGVAMWCDLFENSRIIGLDIDLSHFYKNINNLIELDAFSNNFPETYEFDQYINNKVFLKRLLKGDKIDVCIDDGCHRNKCILTSFQSILPYLAENFIYFIEDNIEVHNLIREIYPELIVIHEGELTIVTRKMDL